MGHTGIWLETGEVSQVALGETTARQHDGSPGYAAAHAGAYHCVMTEPTSDPAAGDRKTPGEQALPELVDRNCDVCGSADSVVVLDDHTSAYHRCGECGLIYTSPIPADYTAANEGYYEDVVDKYAHKVETRLDDIKRVLRMFDRYRTANRFLEVGCNTGATLVAAQELGWQAEGVDISRAATAYARDTLGLSVFTGPLEAAEFESGRFDVVYSNAVLEHLEHPYRTMCEVARVLRPGGVFFADTVNWDSYTQRYLGAHWRYLDPLHHLHIYTPDNVRELAERAGLTVERIWTTGVRLKDKRRGEVYSAPWYLHAIKGVLSAATRVNRKGDSIKFLLRRPGPDDV